MTPQALGKLMGISPKLADLNAHRYHAWSLPFTSRNAKQAALAFKGDVYTGLDADTLSAADLKYAQKHLRILSGLHGVLRPLDLMQPYRLEMGTKLKTNRGGDLYAFWNGRINAALTTALKKQKDNILVNLASNEYFKSVKAAELDARIVAPVFKERKNGEYKLISFFAKKARGLMSRYIIRNRLDNPEDLKGFDLEGYHTMKPCPERTGRSSPGTAAFEPCRLRLSASRAACPLRLPQRQSGRPLCQCPPVSITG